MSDVRAGRLLKGRTSVVGFSSSTFTGLIAIRLES
jgi:hypothetical protein